MKKRKTPFIWVIVVMALAGIAYVFNFKEENPSANTPPPQQQQQQAPSESQLKNSVTQNLKSTIPTPKVGGAQPSGQPIIEKPQEERHPTASKPDLSTQTLGQWYHQDSVKSASSK